MISHINNLLYGFPVAGVAVQLLTCAYRVHFLDVLLQLHTGLSYYLVVFLHHFCSQERTFGADSLARRWLDVTWGQLDFMLWIYRA